VTATLSIVVSVPTEFDVIVAPTPELARLVIDKPVPFVSVVMVGPSKIKDSVIEVDVGTDLTKYPYPAVKPFVVLPKTITSSAIKPCADPVAISEVLVIVVQVGVVPPSA
jgi:hypothetical protein